MSNYRPEIDGLRAVAVLSVIFFHLGYGWAPGGYVGVDVFFVISGFLITKLIRDEVVATGRFSFSHFFVRRARRLFPALFVTLAASLAIASFILAPQHLQEFGGSLVYAIASLSNVYFWLQAGYFDTDSALKPLLHTWSLGVEEQFYLFWPLLILILLRATRRLAWAAPAVIAVAFLGSLGLNILLARAGASPRLAALLGDQRSALFFLTPFRVFEFAIGAVLVWGGRLRSRMWLDDLASAAGLVLIVYSAATFSASAVFPTANALIPCIGAALIIAAGPSGVSRIALMNAPTVWLGRISYSLYLVHWPMIVFVKYYQLAPLSETQRLSILMIAVICAAGMHYLIENPFRTRNPSLSPPAFGLICALLAISVLLPSASAWATGWLWRFPKSVAEQLSFRPGDLNIFTALKQRLWDVPFLNNNDRLNVLVIGDSQGGDLVNALIAGDAFRFMNLSSLPAYDCVPVLPDDPNAYSAAKFYIERRGPDFATSCAAKLAQFKETIVARKPDVVMLAGYWIDWSIDLLPETVRFLRDVAGARKVFVVGSKIQTVSGVQFFAKYGARPNLDRVRSPLNPSTVAVNRRLKEISSDFTFIDPQALFCAPEGCQMATKEGFMVLFDELHLTPEGAKFLGTRLVDEWGEKIGGRK